MGLRLGGKGIPSKLVRIARGKKCGGNFRGILHETLLGGSHSMSARRVRHRGEHFTKKTSSGEREGHEARRTGGDIHLRANGAS